MTRRRLWLVSLIWALVHVSCCVAQGTGSASVPPVGSFAADPLGTISPLDRKIEQAVSVPDDEDINFVVGITSKSDTNAKLTPGRTTTMTTKSGVKFQCSIPSQNDEGSISAPGNAIAPADLKQRIQDKLKKTCFEKNLGYWTYKVCPFKDIIQFHREASGAQAMVFQLGTYDPEGDTLPTEITPYLQKYKNGSDGRKAELRFTCAEEKPKAKTEASSTKDSKIETAITAVSEPKMHNYDITIETPLACGQVSDPNNAGFSSSAASVVQVLSPLKKSCVYHNTGWWTYEFCYLDKMRQFHQEAIAGEKDQQPKMTTTVDYLLGRFDKEVTADNVQSVTSIHRKLNVEDSYVSQIYTDGTLCDLTKKPRKSEIQFFCDAHEATHIDSVTETATCQYLVKIMTPTLCAHPLFKPKTPSVRTIVCQPIKDSASVMHTRQ